ncbi:MAG: ABC transporter ATP-binding protein [Candidatus Zixiibacteriota bacterium]
MYKLSAEKLSKRFGSRKVFEEISFELTTGQTLAVIGPNGAGKTTLLLTLMGGYTPSRGKVTYLFDNKILDEETLRDKTALVAPYLNLYDSLTAEENLVFFMTMAGGSVTGKEISALLERVGLTGRGDDLVGSYSSGMKQRLKYAAALLKKPIFLFLDEPTSNLDEAGKKIAFDIIEELKQKIIVVIATNEPKERDLAEQVCRIDG